MRPRPGGATNPAGGGYSDPPDLLAGFKSGREGMKGKERRREGRGRE